MDPPKKMKLYSTIEHEIRDPVMVPVLPDDLVEDTPTTNVYYDTVKNPRDISKTILELNRILPLLEFGHLKRVRQKDILLSPVSQMDRDKIQKLLREHDFDDSRLQNDIRIAEVAKVPPQTRRQFENLNKLWPCNFHPNKYLESLTRNELFSKKEIEDHVIYMKIAIDLAKYAKEHYRNEDQVGVVIVDPQIKSVVAVGYRINCNVPCQHAVMIAVDNVAKTQNGGALNTNDVEMRNGGDDEASSRDSLDMRGIPSDILRFLRSKYNNTSFGATRFRSKDELDSPDAGPYLCTNYYVYVTTEPCTMCAMGLIHSRAKRVFYGTKSEFGALGTMCKIHTVRDLNHHYEVFAGLLEKDCAEL